MIEEETNWASIKAGGIEKYEDPEFLEAGTDVIKKMLWMRFTELGQDDRKSVDFNKSKKKHKKPKELDPATQRQQEEETAKLKKDLQDRTEEVSSLKDALRRVTVQVQLMKSPTWISIHEEPGMITNIS